MARRSELRLGFVKRLRPTDSGPQSPSSPRGKFSLTLRRLVAFEGRFAKSAWFHKKKKTIPLASGKPKQRRETSRKTKGPKQPKTPTGPVKS